MKDRQTVVADFQNKEQNDVLSALTRTVSTDLDCEVYELMPGTRLVQKTYNEALLQDFLDCEMQDSAPLDKFVLGSHMDMDEFESEIIQPDLEILEPVSPAILSSGQSVKLSISDCTDSTDESIETERLLSERAMCMRSLDKDNVTLNRPATWRRTSTFKALTTQAKVLKSELTNTVLTERFSRSTMSSATRSMVQSVARMSAATSNQSTSSLIVDRMSSATFNQTTPSLMMEEPILHEDLPNTSQQMRFKSVRQNYRGLSEEAYTSAVSRLYPCNLEGSSSRKLGDYFEDVIDCNMSPENPSSKHVLTANRHCCDLQNQIQLRKEAQLHLKKRLSHRIPLLRAQPSKIVCEACGLRNIHLDAMEFDLYETALPSLHKDLTNLSDRYDNSLFHFAASRSHDILGNVTQLIWAYGSPPQLAGLNEKGQHFLFALNPTGLGSSLEQLDNLLSAIRNSYPTFDFNHRDVQGRTFLHYLFGHPNMPALSTEVESNLANAGSKHVLLQYVDNTGHWPLHPILRPGIDPSPSAIGSRWDWIFQRCLRGHVPQHPQALLVKVCDMFLSSYPAQECLGEAFMSTPSALTHVVSPYELYDKDDHTLLLAIVNAFEQINDNYLTSMRPYLMALTECLLDPSTHCQVGLELVDRSGESALFIATRKGYRKLTRQLLYAGAKYNIRNHAGVSLLTAARDELRRARHEATDESVRHYCDVMVCMIMVLDYDFGVPIVASEYL